MHRRGEMMRIVVMTGAQERVTDSGGTSKASSGVRANWGILSGKGNICRLPNQFAMGERQDGARQLALYDGRQSVGTRKGRLE
jgi:hypothetical protein